MDSRWISRFTMDFWIHDGFLDSQWISGFSMDFWIHDGFLDSQRIHNGFSMDFWIHDGFLDSRWIPRSAMNFWKTYTSDYVAAGAFFFSENSSPYVWKSSTSDYVAAGVFSTSDKWLTNLGAIYNSGILNPGQCPEFDLWKDQWPDHRWRNSSGVPCRRSLLAESQHPDR